MRPLVRLYGDRPRHLLAMAVALVLAVYAWTRIFQHAHPWAVVAWFVGAIVVHDFVFLPLYTALYAAGFRAGHVEREPRRRVPILHHVVVPAAISGMLLVVWLPEILRVTDASFHRLGTTSSDGYVPRWLAVTGGLFVVSGLLYAVRRVRAR